MTRSKRLRDASIVPRVPEGAQGESSGNSQPSMDNNGASNDGESSQEAALGNM